MIPKCPNFFTTRNASITWLKCKSNFGNIVGKRIIAYLLLCSFHSWDPNKNKRLVWIPEVYSIVLKWNGPWLMPFELLETTNDVVVLKTTRHSTHRAQWAVSSVLSSSQQSSSLIKEWNTKSSPLSLSSSDGWQSTTPTDNAKFVCVRGKMQHAGHWDRETLQYPLANNAFPMSDLHQL